MTRRSNRERGGSTAVEFTLVGIPMLFLLISTFEMARGMWIYHTLAYAMKQGTRYAVVHGEGCWTSPNTCGAHVSDVAAAIQSAGLGLLPDQMTVTLTPASGSAKKDTLTNLLADTTDVWPPSTPAGVNAAGQTVTISAVYPFRSALAMFWPAKGGMSGPGLVYLAASSSNRIVF